jgi:5,6,7,8-tetrahydromethanopterin hydro-lyase
VARAVVDSVKDGVIPKDQVDDLCIIVSVFIHWEAEDDQKIYDYNYEAVKMSISRAMNGEPSMDQVLADTPAARHPFAGGAEG